jgi:nitroreductase
MSLASFQKQLNLDQLIKQRRSIRNFKATEPPQEWIEDLITCASQAPSPSNKQPVRFARIVSEKKKQLMRDNLRLSRDHLIMKINMLGLKKQLKNKVNAYFRFSDFMFDAPWLFAVGVENPSQENFNISLINAGLAGNFQLNSDDISVGLAIQLFILKATEMGLGTCILTGPLIFVPDLGKMPDFSHMNLKCFIAAGFPDESPNMPIRKSVSTIYREI